MTAIEEGATFLSLLAEHERLFELFHLHQEALLERDLRDARARLEQFERELQVHMRAEEELFADVFAHSGASGVPLDLFTGEHRRMRDLLAHFRARADALDPLAPALKRDVLALLDEEAVFKSFYLHHDDRERNLLYPALDRNATPDARRGLLERFHRGG